ncbi:MAG: hypothetical protein IJZ72_03995 [Oscillospiraceae bacterium]|nr:hypothetical protein [Oscillospiraceae bacterium]
MSRQDKIVKYIVFTMNVIVVLAALTGFILLGAVGCGIGAVISAACAYGIYRLKKPVTVVHFTGVILLALSLTFTQPLKGVFAWQYGFQKLYIENVGGFEVNSFFPDELAGYNGSFRSEFMPSIMLEDGWFMISFDTDSINKYENNFKYTLRRNNKGFSFSGYEARNGYSDKTIETMRKNGYGEYASEYFMLLDDISDNAVVYVLYTNCGFDYLNAEIGVIDGDRVYLIKQ